MSYEAGLDALDTVRKIIASHHLPLIKQRKFNGICNAIAMQIDDGEYCVEIVAHLGNALLALAKAYQVETSPVEDALRNLQRSLEA